MENAFELCIKLYANLLFELFTCKFVMERYLYEK